MLLIEYILELFKNLNFIIKILNFYLFGNFNAELIIKL